MRYITRNLSYIFMLLYVVHWRWNLKTNTYIAHWKEQRHNSKIWQNGLIYSGKIAILFRIFQQKRHSCIFKIYPREGAKVIIYTIQTCATSNLKLPILKIHEFWLVTFFFPMSELYIPFLLHFFLKTLLIFLNYFFETMSLWKINIILSSMLLTKFSGN